MPIETSVSKYHISIPDTFRCYETLYMIGRGGFSVVVLVRNTKTKIQYACKIVPRQLLEDLNCFDRFEREINLQRSLKHPHILQIIDYFKTNDLYFIVTEYCENGTLLSILRKHGKFNEDQARRMFYQIVSGIQYMHTMDVVHRDLKPENILVNSTGSIKIADFGLCHQTNEEMLLATPCGSCCYAPPEVITGQKYDGKLFDSWSAGVVLYTMTTANLPWQHLQSLPALSADIIEGHFEIPDYLSQSLKDLITRCLEHEPKNRIQISEILDHPWLGVNTPFIGITQCKSTGSVYQHHGLVKTSTLLSGAIRTIEPSFTKKRSGGSYRKIQPISSFQF